MLNNPNEWHNIEEESADISGEAVNSVPNSVSPDFIKANMQYIKLGMLVVAVLFIVFLAFSKIQAKKNEVASQPQTPEQMANYFYDKASSPQSQVQGQTGAEEQMAVVDVNLSNDPNATLPSSSPSQNPSPSNDPLLQAQNGYSRSLASPDVSRKTVVVSVGDEGRDNPFLPFKEKKVASIAALPSAPNLSFDLVEPPAGLIDDPQAEKLLKTTISGIMYDSRSPSAIVNVNGQDQLVRKNDRLSGFSILDITRDKVVVKSGTNIYRASVGQSIMTEGVNINEVANLKNKFGGSYRPAARNTLEFKAN